MSLGSFLKDGLIQGLLNYLDTVLLHIKGQLASGGEADEQVKKACAVLLVYRQELTDLAKRSDTNFDDILVNEVEQFAAQVLPPELVAQIEDLYGEEEPEPAVN